MKIKVISLRWLFSYVHTMKHTWFYIKEWEPSILRTCWGILLHIFRAGPWTFLFLDAHRPAKLQLRLRRPVSHTLNSWDNDPFLGSCFLVPGCPLWLPYGFGTGLKLSHPLAQTDVTFIPHPRVSSVSQVWMYLVQERCSVPCRAVKSNISSAAAPPEGDAALCAPSGWTAHSLSPSEAPATTG